LNVHLIITDAWMAKSRPVHLSGFKLTMALLLAALVLVVASFGLYHMVFLKGAREGWPIVGSLVRLVVKDESVARERYLRENLDAMAKRLGEMQARVVQLEALGERVASLAGVPAAPAKTVAGRGGMLIGEKPLSMEDLNTALQDLEQLTNQRVDLMTVIESRLIDQKIKTSMVPTQDPAPNAREGSSFGWRIDPITGRQALHTGMDFPGDVGTPIVAAAGGVVVRQEEHPAYGNLVEINHGNDLSTLYAHASKVFVKQGDLIKRGQKIAEIGSTGRSTGPHLHFEVLVQGVPQDPQPFLTAGDKLSQIAMAAPGQVDAAAKGQAGQSALGKGQRGAAPAPRVK
jgi:murein DD-endopeptidase MepM/ murein hydrolase activator NlpD